MANRDSAFLWETEALRSFPRPTHRANYPSSVSNGPWLTLKEASEATGVPVDTIRKWARHGNIPSYLADTPNGELRMVSLDGINRWANTVGREIEVDLGMHEEEADLASEELTGRSEEETPVGATEADIPEDTMLVPLDAWNKMLNQLGNLHDAGQQLAEARERAARAETEATFLKERLSDMRAELEKARVITDEPAKREAPPTRETDETDDPDLSVTRFTRAKARQLYRRWRSR